VISASSEGFRKIGNKNGATKKSDIYPSAAKLRSSSSVQQQK